MFTPPVRKVTYRKLKSVNIVDFQQDILDSGIHLDSDMSLNGFVSFYNSTLHDCLKKHAPITTRTISVRPRVAWFSEEIKCAKREKRKAERKWRTTKLRSDLLHFKRKRAFCTYLMKNSTFITVLLLMIIALIRENCSKPVNISLILRMIFSFPSHSDAFKLANDDDVDNDNDNDYGDDDDDDVEDDDDDKDDDDDDDDDDGDN